MKPLKIAEYYVTPGRDYSISIDGQIISAVHNNGTEGIAWYGFKLYNMGKKSKRITLTITRNTLKFTISNIKLKKEKTNEDKN